MHRYTNSSARVPRDRDIYIIINGTFVRFVNICFVRADTRRVGAQYVVAATISIWKKYARRVDNLHRRARHTHSGMEDTTFALIYIPRLEIEPFLIGCLRNASHRI